MFNDWLTRRFMAKVSPNIEPGLKHYWDGADALVNGLWIDRVNGLGWTATNNPVHNTDNYVCGKSVGFFQMALNAAAPNGLRIGQYWRIEIDFEIVSLNNILMVIDFGSLTGASHAFGLLSGSPYDGFIDNYKGFSNDTTYSAAFVLDSNLSVGDRMTVKFGCEKYSETDDVQFIEIDGVKTYGAPHAQTEFNANFNNSNGYIGRGHLTSYCGGSIKVYSLKIYANN